MIQSNCYYSCMDELLDLVNENDEVIGTISRAKAHTDVKYIHREIVVCIFDDELEHVLLQKRSKHKRNSRGTRWKITAAGHVGVGEDPMLTARREIEEELGLADVDLEFVSKHYVVDNELTESKFYWLYVGQVPRSTELRLHPDEVEEAGWYGLHEVADMVGTESHSHQYIRESLAWLQNS